MRFFQGHSSTFFECRLVSGDFSAIMLNDKYSVDGRDPNGYTRRILNIDSCLCIRAVRSCFSFSFVLESSYVGCMWAIGGIHDMGWAERPIFGMSDVFYLKLCFVVRLVYVLPIGLCFASGRIMLWSCHFMSFACRENSIHELCGMQTQV